MSGEDELLDFEESEDLGLENEVGFGSSVKASDSRRRLEEYMEMKRLKELLDDDYDLDVSSGF